MQYRNYIFDSYGTLIDIHTDEESILLWDFMADYLKRHFNTITTASKLKSDYLKLCADETKKLAAKNGSNVYLLSNAQRLFTEKELADTWLTDLLDDIFISSDKGIKKPDSAFIKALIEKHNLDTSTTVMVGNEIKADVGSAIAAGINGVYLNTYHHTHEEIAQELASIGYDKSNIEFTLVDEGENCFNKMSWL